MTADIHLNSERRNSTSSTNSNPYKNQLNSSYKKHDYNKTSELRNTITGDSFRPKYEYGKVNKPQMHFSPKVSLNEGR